MRFYRLKITRPADGYLAIPNFNGQPGFSWVPNDGLSATYTSLNQGGNVFQPGSTNMSAQAVELDVTAGVMHLPISNSYIKVHGVGLGEIAQASNLNFMNATLEVGLARGLPLANPAQIGTIISGQALQVIGNWEPGDQFLSFFFAVGGSSPSSNQQTGLPNSYTSTPLPSTNATPSNIVFSWQPGQKLLDALVPTLTTAYPKYEIRGAVSDGLVRSGAPANGFYNTLEQLAGWVNQMSQSLLQGSSPAPFFQNYLGVCLTLQNSVITIQDGSTPTVPKQIQFTDLVGQPAWTGPYEFQVVCAMRGDIQAGDFVVLPPVLGTITSGSASQWNTQPGGTNAGGPYAALKNSSAFQGTFLVINTRAVGASRTPGAESWVTTLNCLQMPVDVQPTANSASQLPVLASPNTAYQFYLPT